VVENYKPIKNHKVFFTITGLSIPEGNYLNAGFHRKYHLDYTMLIV
jgi:hypothetical protein